MGGSKMEFITKATGSYVIKLDANQEIAIVYLFPKVQAGDTIRIGRLRPIGIQ
jgi:hypothetical protein